MYTKIMKIKENCNDDIIEEASKVLRDGGLVAFPTETVYGLGGNALDESVARKIYEAKGRPSDNPLIIHIGEIDDIIKLAKDIPSKVYQLINKFWPGPLTIILKKHSIVPDGTTGGLDTVAIRMPDNFIARELINKSGVFIAAPSANISGRPSTTQAKHVIDDLEGKIDVIIDGGSSTLGLESTIVDFTEEIPTILRPGFITLNQISEVIGDVIIDLPSTDGLFAEGAPKAPGMKYKHYAPKGELFIYEGELEKVVSVINEQAKENYRCGKKVGIIATEETKDDYDCGVIKIIGSRKDERTIASRLYGVLREFDDINTDIILTEAFVNGSLGDAIMNRLLKAAGYNVIKV